MVHSIELEYVSIITEHAPQESFRKHVYGYPLNRLLQSRITKMESLPCEPEMLIHSVYTVKGSKVGIHTQSVETWAMSPNHHSEFLKVVEQWICDKNDYMSFGAFYYHMLYRHATSANASEIISPTKHVIQTIEDAEKACYNLSQGEIYTLSDSGIELHMRMQFLSGGGFEYRLIAQENDRITFRGIFESAEMMSSHLYSIDMLGKEWNRVYENI